MKVMAFQEHVIPGKRLGRHVKHDPKSWGFPAPMSAVIQSVNHTRHVPIFDQGALGSCTGNASVGCISTGPFTFKGTEKDAVDVYSAATVIDPFLGTYPPTDTGSNGLSVMKVLQQRALIKGYTHVFDVNAFLRALVLRPGIVGMTWLSGCDNPDSRGVVQYRGIVRGGHEVCARAIDVPNKLVWFDNSWSSAWGHLGSFAMSFEDTEKALADNGDATFPLV